MTKHTGAVNPHSVIFSKEFTGYTILRYSESSIATETGGLYILCGSSSWVSGLKQFNVL